MCVWCVCVLVCQLNTKQQRSHTNLGRARQNLKGARFERHSQKLPVNIGVVCSRIKWLQDTAFTCSATLNFSPQKLWNTGIENASDGIDANRYKGEEIGTVLSAARIHLSFAGVRSKDLAKLTSGQSRFLWEGPLAEVLTGHSNTDLQSSWKKFDFDQVFQWHPESVGGPVNTAQHLNCWSFRSSSSKCKKEIKNWTYQWTKNAWVFHEWTCVIGTLWGGKLNVSLSWFSFLSGSAPQRGTNFAGCHELCVNYVFFKPGANFLIGRRTFFWSATVKCVTWLVAFNWTRPISWLGLDPIGV